MGIYLKCCKRNKINYIINIYTTLYIPYLCTKKMPNSKAAAQKNQSVKALEA